MPIHPLPANPSLEHLRNQAKTLRRFVRAGAREALALVAEFHPAPAVEPAAFKLADAYLVTARMYGFTSWPRFRRHVEIVTAYSRSPHRIDHADDPAVEFLRLACLTYGDDHPDRLPRARRMLAEHPEIARATIHTMGATGQADAMRKLLARDPSQAGAKGGPYGWEPLLYLAYSRIDSPSHLETARLLLDNGADPNAGYLWEGLIPPFTALTGAFGQGEGDQPPHPDEWELARLLLERGADPNDGQTLYNRGLGGSWSDDTEHLELLLEFGLGRGSGGPWRARLGPAQITPAQMLRDELLTAALRGGPRRARLLLRHGVQADCRGGHPAFGGRTPYELALLGGHTQVARLLAEAGATADLDDLDAFVAACMRADGPLVDRLRTAAPGLIAMALQKAPDLINRAAEHGNAHAVRLLAGLGFDVDHRRRVTPLHHAAFNGDLAMVELLIELGADPGLTDTDHDATPLGWARYKGHHQVTAYLAHHARNSSNSR